ncbi:MarR family transcriptional regulator [Acutalibacter sp. 1XD8-33]|uniref:MarR family winged helix-turn-helix transcriptional regulator n=1 Tax=Acutalibacter sp. 1XD8-33 TaxID=2320081 RepID=UPI000EA38074|nr:MarR family transcriptional regulator [Acutalibacter sp. 1XD8-33]RKJ41080.1 MarR family transcriptional regulator [Acutalibacter sp. 1XD8-33]
MRKEDGRPCVPKPGRADHQNEIGFQINGLSHMIRWLTHQYIGEDGGRSGVGVYGWLIGFIYENRDRDIYQRDLQQQFSVRRSTMTGILQAMEKEGMIIRRPVEWDARLKKIELTEKAVECQERFQRNIAEIEARLSSGLTPEEKETFIRLCEKIRESLA